MNNICPYHLILFFISVCVHVCVFSPLEGIVCAHFSPLLGCFIFPSNLSILKYETVIFFTDIISNLAFTF